MATHLPHPGELNCLIVIRTWADVPNAAFGLDQTFDPGTDCWAKREPIHSIAMRAGQNTSESPSDLFWVRWSVGTRPDDITVSHVVEFEGHRFRVLDAIDVDNAHRFTRITTKDLGAI